MEMEDLYLTFIRLKEEKGKEGTYKAARISENMPHKIGATDDGHPMFFIECADDQKLSDIKLERFKVLFNRQCLVQDVDETDALTHNYSVIFMNSNNSDLQRYFFQVVYLVLERLPLRPKTETLKVEISKIIELFTAPPKFSKEVVRGLWAELLVIERGNNPEYLLKSWHEDTVDKYDFNDSIDKVEVKSTAGATRSHVFALEQLVPNTNSHLLVASIFVNQVGIGKNIFDLLDSICLKVADPDLQIKVKELTYKTIGPHVEESAKLRFDYKNACDTYLLYNYKDIPSIPLNSIPIEVSSVHFKVDLSNTKPYDSSYQSKLFESL